MEQFAKGLRLTVAADLDRASADTIVKRVGRRLGITGGQCRRSGEKFVGGAGEDGAWVWFYDIRGCPIEIVRTAGTTSVVVPPLVIDGDESQPWILAHLFRLELFKRFAQFATVFPVPHEPQQGEQACPEKSTKPPRETWRSSSAGAARSAWQRVASVFTNRRSRGGSA